jgi:hypothetical protein
MLSDHARKAAEYLDGFIAKPSVKIAESIIAQAIADATAEQGECYYQLEIHGDDGWEVLSNPVTDKDLTGDQKKLSAWFDGVKVYHKHQGMRLVKVTKQVLHERAALEAALNT